MTLNRTLITGVTLAYQTGIVEQSGPDPPLGCEVGIIGMMTVEWPGELQGILSAFKVREPKHARTRAQLRAHFCVCLCVLGARQVE